MHSLEIIFAQQIIFSLDKTACTAALWSLQVPPTFVYTFQQWSCHSIKQFTPLHPDTFLVLLHPMLNVQGYVLESSVYMNIYCILKGRNNIPWKKIERKKKKKKYWDSPSLDGINTDHWHWHIGTHDIHRIHSIGVTNKTKKSFFFWSLVLLSWLLPASQHFHCMLWNCNFIFQLYPIFKIISILKTG